MPVLVTNAIPVNKAHAIDFECVHSVPLAVTPAALPAALRGVTSRAPWPAERLVGAWRRNHRRDRFVHRINHVDEAKGFIRNEILRPVPIQFDHGSGKWKEGGSEDPGAVYRCVERRDPVFALCCRALVRPSALLTVDSVGHLPSFATQNRDAMGHHGGFRRLDG